MNKAAGIGVLAAIVLFVWSSCAHAQIVIVPQYDPVSCEDLYNHTVYEEQLRLQACVNQNYPNTNSIYTCQQIVEQQTNDQLYNSQCQPYFLQYNLVIFVGPGFHHVWNPHHEWHHEHRGPQHEHEREHHEHEHHEHDR